MIFINPKEHRLEGLKVFSFQLLVKNLGRVWVKILYHFEMANRKLASF
jgi:hypothetical protein